MGCFGSRSLFASIAPQRVAGAKFVGAQPVRCACAGSSAKLDVRITLTIPFKLEDCALERDRMARQPNRAQPDRFARPHKDSIVSGRMLVAALPDSYIRTYERSNGEWLRNGDRGLPRIMGAAARVASFRCTSCFIVLSDVAQLASPF